MYKWCTNENVQCGVNGDEEKSTYALTFNQFIIAFLCW